MARAREFWTRFYSLFQANEILADRRGVAFYSEREETPFQKMLRDFDRNMSWETPPIAFFSGHRGSGKSSLLVRLWERLRRDYFVLYFNIENNLDLAKLNQIDLLYTIGAAIYRVAEQEKIKLDKKLLHNLALAVHNVTRRDKDQARTAAANVNDALKGLTVFGASAIAGDLGQALAEAAGKVFNFAAGVGVTDEVLRKQNLEPQIQEITSAVNALIEAVEAHTEYPLLVIVDGLDKIIHLAQAKLIFLESTALRGPRCRLIYTVPMFFYGDEDFGQLEEGYLSYWLPNIKLYQRAHETERHEKGYDTMREIVNRRLNVLGLTHQDLFTDEALDLLIQKSGGLVRWFIELIYQAGQYAEERDSDIVTLEIARKAASYRASRLGLRLRKQTRAALREVRQTKWPEDSDEVRQMLHLNWIVAYQNDDIWFDAHPLLWDYLT